MQATTPAGAGQRDVGTRDDVTRDLVGRDVVAPDAAPLLEMRGITKLFAGVVANDGVDFDVRRGEVHTLFGENGAGKSTLMRVLYGLYHPDAGEIRIDGETVTIASPTDAIRRGIGMIHQHFMLVNTLTVAENVGLGLASSRGPVTDLDRVAARLGDLAERYGLKVDPRAQVWQLSVGERQRVEILKALYRNVALLVLDEPTAVLTPREVDDLFAVLRQMASDGRSLVFISHKVREVLGLSDRITVLRNGRRVATLPVAKASRDVLVEMMVGHAIPAAPTDDRAASGAALIGDAPVALGQSGLDGSAAVAVATSTEPVASSAEPVATPSPVRLSIRGLTVRGDRGTDAVRDLSLDVHSGEIVGIAGVSGNGQRELAEAIAGLRPSTFGQIEVEGAELRGSSPSRVRAAGVGYVPEERMRDGVVGDFSVAENLVLVGCGQAPFARLGFLRRGHIRQACRDLVEAFDIKTPGLDTPVRNLSGGNIQKLIMARELSGGPRVLLVAQPTRGIDVAAAQYIHGRLREQRSAGTAVLIISEDLDEVMSLADRIVVMYEGEIIGAADPRVTTREAIGLLMAGVRNPTAASSRPELRLGAPVPQYACDAPDEPSSGDRLGDGPGDRLGDGRSDGSGNPVNGPNGTGEEATRVGR